MQAYFDRIDHRGGTEPTRETLAALVAAHVRHIPFENLDPLMGVPIVDLSAAALTAKLVARRRGGYCYEHNNLLAEVLTELGYHVERLAARVVWMSPEGVDGPPRPQTHQGLAVTIPGSPQHYLVDVGFGGQTPTAPIPMVPDAVQQTSHEPFRLREHGADLVLETLIGQRWRPLYIMGLQPRPLIDLQVGSWYVSTYPESNFVVGLTAALVTDDARWNLRGRNLAIHADGGTERVRFDDAAQVCAELTGRFGIDLSGLGDVEAKVATVLDT
ncbi:arylamine N-acetyltransferase [[Mycobacterium] kokjensenii]|uniref:Arylamine N-acetyltransferase n=1 Tax=[Mycobacterium] kokjensenii TaxID=3064287 RepID=A0ABM9L6A9_9MYCO|nr:arylamine N-acetyltransferase [Mycolicibacter sp. MU0083]CAJ1493119.1 arylamine N-acetyltransferase [Mycolicibacter sp. MU0083]